MIIIYELTHESSLTHKPTAHIIYTIYIQYTYIYRYTHIHIHTYISTVHIYSHIIHNKDRISGHSFYFIARSMGSEEVNQF